MLLYKFIMNVDLFLYERSKEIKFKTSVVLHKLSEDTT